MIDDFFGNAFCCEKIISFESYCRATQRDKGRCPPQKKQQSQSLNRCQCESDLSQLRKRVRIGERVSDGDNRRDVFGVGGEWDTDTEITGSAFLHDYCFYRFYDERGSGPLWSGVGHKKEQIKKAAVVGRSPP